MAWDPIEDLRAWQERLERLTIPHSESWAPPIDVYETATAYVVSAEVPGLTREQVELALEESRLTIQAERADRAAKGGTITRYHQVERGHGRFARTFEFAEKIDVERVTADLTNGVLTISLPKVPPPPARKIEVK
jgi:HSP20 family protein